MVSTLFFHPLQDSLASKVNVDDLASLMPQGGGGGGADEAATASLMSKLIEIQNRLAQVEGEICDTRHDDLSSQTLA